MSSHKSHVLIICLGFVLAVILGGCAGSHDESIGGVQVPIPRGMNKSPEHGVEVSLPGFGGAQASYEGSVDPENIVAFYKKELPARGWQPAAGILAKGGMLSYTKEGKGLMVTVGSNDGKTALTIMVAGAPGR